MVHQRVRKVTCLFLICTIFACSALFSIRPSSASAASWSFVRIIHASPDAGTVDVFVDGNKLLSNFQFGTVTQYVPIPPGGHKVQISLIGTGINAAVITQSISVNPSTAYTVAALGMKATGYSLKIFNDNNVISGNQAEVRVYHLSPGTGSVSVANGSDTVVSELSYPQASSYVNVSPGSYTFDVSVPNSQNVPVSTMLKPLTVTSVFAIGMVNGTPNFQFVSAQVAGIPGMPGTGSDPNAHPAQPQNAQPLAPWIPVSLLLLMLGAGVTTRRLMVAHHKG